MTLAVIVARKDDFFIIADTRSSEVHQAKGPIYHDQEQKVFHSSKHKIGLAIAGEAVLPDPSESGNVDKQIRTSWLLKQFFVYIEARNSIAVDKLFSLLMQFIGTKYPQILTPFKERVSLFYGGFMPIHGHQVTAIFSYHEEQSKCFYYNDTCLNQQLCAFSNFPEKKDSNGTVVYPDLISHFLKFYLHDSAASFIAQNNFLLHCDFGSLRTIMTIILRDHVIGRFDPTVIGIYFNYIKIDPTPTSPLISQKWQITGTGSQQQLISITDFPHALVDAKTTADFQQKFQGGELHYYHLDGNPIHPDPPPLTP